MKESFHMFYQFMFKKKKKYMKKNCLHSLGWKSVNIWMTVPAAIVSAGDLLLNIARSNL